MIQIKITGSGSKEEITKALGSLITFLEFNYTEADFETPKTFEDETLFTHISKVKDDE
jgi:hypothetical protein